MTILLYVKIVFIIFLIVAGLVLLLKYRNAQRLPFLPPVDQVKYNRMRIAGTSCLILALVLAIAFYLSENYFHLKGMMNGGDCMPSVNPCAECDEYKQGAKYLPKKLCQIDRSCHACTQADKPLIDKLGQSYMGKQLRTQFNKRVSTGVEAHQRYVDRMCDSCDTSGNGKPGQYPCKVCAEECIGRLEQLSKINYKPTVGDIQNCQKYYDKA